MGINLKEFIDGFVETTKFYIKRFEEIKNLTNEEKKERLDELLINYCEKAIDTLGVNFLFKLVLKKILIANIPHLTQTIFNLIRLKIEGITR